VDEEEEEHEAAKCCSCSVCILLLLLLSVSIFCNFCLHTLIRVGLLDYTPPAASTHTVTVTHKHRDRRRRRRQRQLRRRRQRRRVGLLSFQRNVLLTSATHFTTPPSDHPSSQQLTVRAKRIDN